MGTRNAPLYERPGPRDPKVPLTVVIAARNAAAHIGACVASVANWADEVLVVENDSTDDTVLLASVEGATVFSHPFATIGGQRNAAIARARNEWVLVLDADERCTAQLSGEVERVVGASGVALPPGDPGASPSFDAYRVRRRNFFLGREIRHGGWERDRPVRLFRRHLRYDPRPVHEHVVLPAGSAGAGELAAPMLHYTYSSLDEYFEKFGRYSAWWAQQSYERGRRASAAAVLLRPPARFVSMYLLRLGFLDGAHGLVLAVLAATSVAAKYARLWALGRTAPATPRAAAERRD